MSGKHMAEEEWERVFRMKREIESMMERHTLADVMAREKSPYLLANQDIGANRAERRKQAARSRKVSKHG